jgi:hypothetical protein
MNKLREQIAKWYSSSDAKNIENDILQCEQITDDFSCQFAEWYLSNSNNSDFENWTTTELQQYFKENVYNK